MRIVSRIACMGWVVSGALVHVGCGNSSSTTEGITGPSGSGGTGGTGTGGASVSSSSSGGMGGTGGAGLPFSSEGTSTFESDAAVAANDAGGVVAAWIAFFPDNTSSIGYGVSQDGGDTWTAPAYLASPNGLYASQPVVVADGKKGFVLGWAAFGPDFNMPDEHLYVASLAAGATTFGEPVLVSDDGTSKTRDFDKPRLAVDASNDTLVTWADFTGFNMGAPAALTFARSNDGTTFKPTTVTSDASFGSLAYPCLDRDLGPTAPLYMVHLGSGSTVILHKSTDQGKTWAPHDVPAADVQFQDVTCVAHGNDVWISYASGTASFVPGKNTPADQVEVVHSANGGDAFDAPVTVTAGAAGTQYLFPQIARTAGGELAVVYYRGKETETNELVLAKSADGTAWTEGVIATPGTFILDRNFANWLGDYLGIASAGDSLVFAYGDNTGAKTHIKFMKAAP
jgi:hypothetical protein